MPTARPTAPAAVSPAVTALPAGNRAPVIGAVACDVTAIRVGETALCTCSASDPDGDPLSYEWFVDGFTTRVTAPTFTYRPVEAGQHMIRAVVRDSQGAESYQEMPLQVAPAIPTPLPPPTPTPMPTYVPSPTPIPPTPLPPPTPTEKPTSEPGLTPSPLPIIMPTRSWPTSQAGGW